MNFPAYLDLGPLARAAGTVRLPGSKSISNRMLLLAALADGVTEIRDLLQADDVERMLDALAHAGRARSNARDDAGARARLRGPFPVKSAELFLGNAGTAFRPLTAALALIGRSLSAVGCAAHARAADRRSGRCAARDRRRHPLSGQGGVSAAGDFPGELCGPVRRSACAATCPASSSPRC